MSANLLEPTWIPPSPAQCSATTTERLSPPLALSRAFLWLGIAALIGSGLLAIVLVLARTPGLPVPDALREVFRAALIAHVDLSVLIWFMAFAALAWSLVTPARALPLGWIGWGLAGAGTLVIAASPFLPGATPLLNNYVPVLDQPAFLVGLGLAGAGFGITLLRTLWWSRADTAGAGLPAALVDGARLAALAGALAFASLAWNGATMPALDGAAYYELLFWGPGHVLQFQHALLALVAWLWLLQAIGAAPALAARTARRGFMLAIAPLALLPLLHGVFPLGSDGHVDAFARLMEWGHLFVLPLLVVVATRLRAAWRAAPSPARSALLASLLLYGTGGVLAFMIRGVNLVVPAHYHGSIVGVTLAFMGVVYVLLPRLGFAPAKGRLARWQPWVYGGGQLMHILGLAWSGGYGVQRKVAGADQMLATLAQKAGMGLMGLGGLIAIAGGVLFVVVCLRAMRPRGAPRLSA